MSPHLLRPTDEMPPEAEAVAYGALGATILDQPRQATVQDWPESLERSLSFFELLTDPYEGVTYRLSLVGAHHLGDGLNISGEP